jgi:hypothetical protein
VDLVQEYCSSTNEFEFAVDFITFREDVVDQWAKVPVSLSETQSSLIIASSNNFPVDVAW